MKTLIIEKDKFHEERDKKKINEDIRQCIHSSSQNLRQKIL